MGGNVVKCEYLESVRISSGCELVMDSLRLSSCSSGVPDLDGKNLDLPEEGTAGDGTAPKPSEIRLGAPDFETSMRSATSVMDLHENV